MPDATQIMRDLLRVARGYSHDETTEDNRAMDEAAAWILRQEKLAKDPVLRHMVVGGESVEMTIEVARNFACACVGALKKLLDDAGAKNCVECFVDSQDGARYVFTVQRPGGKTPLQLRTEAEGKVDGLERQIGALKLQINMDAAALNRMQEAGLPLEGIAGELSKLLSRSLEWSKRAKSYESQGGNAVLEAQIGRHIHRVEKMLAEGLPETPATLPSVVLSRFRWLSFLDGNPRIQEVEFNTGLFVQVRGEELPIGWEGKFGPEWFPITELPGFVRFKLGLPT